MTALLPRLRRFALALTGKAVDADDLVQDTVERALRNLDRFVPDTRMDSWLFRIAQNLWIDTVRARKVRATSADGLNEAEAIPFDGVRAVESHTMLMQTLRALAELPDEQRGVVALVLIDGLSYRETASILDVPIGTVTSRLARARDALAVRLNLRAAASEEAHP